MMIHRFYLFFFLLLSASINVLDCINPINLNASNAYFDLSNEEVLCLDWVQDHINTYPNTPLSIVIINGETFVNSHPPSGGLILYNIEGTAYDAECFNTSPNPCLYTCLNIGFVFGCDELVEIYDPANPDLLPDCSNILDCQAEQITQLLASDGESGDWFGRSVSISGDYAIVGSAEHSVNGNSSQGAAYIFNRNGTSWTQQDILIASDGNSDDGFGGGVGIYGDYAIVGASGVDINGDFNQGSAYVFKRNGNSWVQQAKLIADDGDGIDFFGISVSIFDNYVVVGAPQHNGNGAAYVFERIGDNWIQQEKLLAVDGAFNDAFGFRVNIFEDNIIVGATGDDIGGNVNQGSAYIFERNGNNWIQQDKLVALDGASGDVFGRGPFIWNDLAVVGAIQNDVGGNENQGSVYVFAKNGSSWTQQIKLTASDGAAGDHFGEDVCMNNDFMLIGANSDDIGTNSGQGSVYVFKREEDSWLEDNKLIPTDGNLGDNFGNSLSISDNIAIVGAWFSDINNNQDQGAAYIFDICKDNAPITPEPCLTGNIHTIIVPDDVISNIEGETLSNGDFIAIYYDSLGITETPTAVAEWQGESTTLIVCGDDPSTPEKEGFAEGETFIVKVWKNGVEHNVLVNYLPIGIPIPTQTSTFSNLGISIIQSIKTPSNTGEELDCSLVFPISCGSTISGDSSNGSSSAISYPACFDNLVDGSEIIYEFTNTTSQNVLLTLADLQEDLELLLLTECDRIACFEYSDRTGTSSEAIFVEDLPVGTYYLIVEGYTGDESTFTIGIDCGVSGNDPMVCNPIGTLSCDAQTVSGNNFNGSNNVVQYNCSNAYSSGKEVMYGFESPTTRTVQISLNPFSEDLDLFILDDCDPSECLAASTKSGTEEDGLIFTAISNRTYYVVVDGYLGAESSFNLSLICFQPCDDPADCPWQVDCSSAILIECGEVVTGNTIDGDDNADAYGCEDAYTTGRELVYEFQNNETQDIQILLTNIEAGENLDLYVLNECDVFSCLAISNKSQNSDEGLVLEALSMGTYYIVVDGYDGSSSSFSLLLNCESTTQDCQTIELTEGYNFISSNIDPFKTMDELFPVDPNSPVVLIRDEFNNTYSPSIPTPNEIGEWDVTKGYVIQTSDGTAIEFCGQTVDEDTSIPYHTGINFFSYFKEEPQLASESYCDNSDFLQAINKQPNGSGGIITEPLIVAAGCIGSDFTTELYKGYLIVALNDGSHTYSLSGVDDRSIEVFNSISYLPRSFYHLSNNQSIDVMSVIIPPEVAESVLQNGDEIGVFDTEGRLFGSGRYEERMGISFIIKGANTLITDEKTGFEAEEHLYFRLWRQSENKEYNLEVNFVEGPLVFESDVVKFVDQINISNPTNAFDHFKSNFNWNIYPNPTRNNLHISFPNVSKEDFSLALIDMNGKIVKQVFSIPDNNHSSSLLFNTQDLDSGIYVVQLKIGNLVQQKKVVLIK